MQPRNASLVIAYIALGSNLDDPERQIREGLRALDAMPSTRLAAASSLYRSAPAGFHDQPDFVNAVAAVETSLAPRTLLDALLAIERRRGRVRNFPNAPRTLDLDILLYGDRVVSEPGLAIPHPRMRERPFVVVPLAEIAPDAVIPGGCFARDLLGGVDVSQVQQLPKDAR